jgi:hypothetical protein
VIEQAIPDLAMESTVEGSVQHVHRLPKSLDISNKILGLVRTRLLMQLHRSWFR